LILKLEIPEGLLEVFEELFGVPLEYYWDPFWGWERSPKLKQFRKDFPTLYKHQREFLETFIALENEQFEDFRKEAKIILDTDGMRPYGKRQENLLRKLKPNG